VPGFREVIPEAFEMVEKGFDSILRSRLFLIAIPPTLALRCRRLGGLTQLRQRPPPAPSSLPRSEISRRAGRLLAQDLALTSPLWAMSITVDLDFNIEAAAGDKLTGICHHLQRLT
jgi:hypothetical protein